MTNASHLTEAQLRELRSSLEEQLASLQHRVDDKAEFETTELSTADNHPADNATDLTDQEREMALDNLKEQEIADIQEALDAMEKGTYGICAVSGEPIPFERLQALPTAKTMVEHADEYARRQDVVPEQSILNADTANPVRQNAAVADGEDSYMDADIQGSSDGPQDQPERDSESFYRQQP